MTTRPKPMLHARRFRRMYRPKSFSKPFPHVVGGPTRTLAELAQAMGLSIPAMTRDLWMWPVGSKGTA